MKLVLFALRAAFRQMGAYMGLMIVANIATTVLVLPILAIVLYVGLVLHVQSGLALIVGMVIVVLPSPSTAGLQYVTHEAAFLNPVFWRDVLDGLRQYGLAALRIWLVSVAGAVGLAANAAFYVQQDFPGARLIALVWVLALLAWLTIHLYVYPLLMEQEVIRVVLVYRNATLIAISRPIFTLAITGVWWVVVFSTTLTGVIALFGLSLCALIQQNATAVILRTFERRPGGHELKGVESSPRSKEA